MPAGLRASILVIGDEILGGFVQDTNSGWLAGRLQALGIPLDRIVTVPDEVTAIDEALRTELARDRPRVVVTSGGIGSTPDDVTAAAVAYHLGVDLVVQPDIDARITGALERAASQGVTVPEDQARSMRKMARVPLGAYLFTGAPGLAPGIAVDVDGGSSRPGGATVVVLPGVPGELRRSMLEGVEPALLEGRGQPQHVAELAHPYPESVLNPVLQRLVAEFPDLHVGSYPGRRCVVRLKGAKERVEAAMTLVRAGLADLDADPSTIRLKTSWQSRWDEREPEAEGRRSQASVT
ncbi:MAG: molybdopterin-binding protein [Actinomycetota bacterium]|nr:molybdopterin-binding protein [Actinomycetota bacterium]